VDTSSHRHAAGHVAEPGRSDAAAVPAGREDLACGLGVVTGRRVARSHRDRIRPEVAIEVSRVPNRFNIFLSALGLFFIQHLDGAPHDLLLIPVDAFEGNRYPAFRIEDVSLDAVPIHQGFNEVDTELEVTV
jgi:hypothetical protein